jgi:hypothetical protein
MIDDEIRDALNVQPSPEFLARVRTRLANEPAPSRWRWSWALGASAAMAVTLVIVFVVSRPERKKVPAPEVAVELLTNPPSVVPGPRPGKPAESPGPKGPSLHQGSVVSGFSRTRLPRQPEVLVNAAEMRALQGLIVAARNGSVALTPAAAADSPTPMELEPVADIVIAPIAIEPIAPMSGAEGVRP